jgi:diacylglycerol kinase (ATP)
MSMQPHDQHHDQHHDYAQIEDVQFWRSFHHAFNGIIYAARTQFNMRLHLIIAALVLIATLVLRLERFYVVVIIVLIVLVLALELLNTAIEAIVDLLTVVHHPLAKTAKDAAAGAVLIAALGSVIIGYLVFYQGIISGGTRVFTAVQTVPANVAFIVLAVAAIAVVFAKAFAGRRGPIEGTSALQGGAVSGHTTLAFAAATLLALFYQKPLAALLGYFAAFLVAQSRVEGRIHSLFQVIWGAVLGTLVALAIYLLVHPHVVL